MNILIIEDEVLAIEYLKTILNSLGYKNVFEATSCKVGSEVLEQNSIDLIFMDINIKGIIDGIQCGKLLKDTKIPIIYTTAYKTKDIIEETMETNIYGYITKPFSESEVLIAVSMLKKKINEYKKIESIEKKESSNNLIQFDIYTFDYENKTLLKVNSPVILTSNEQLFLEFFIKNSNQILTYDTLRNKVLDEQITDTALRDTIYRLRKKILNIPIKSISKIGYIFELNKKT